MNTPTIARRLSAFACGASDIPNSVLEMGDRAILDTLGAMLAGGAHRTVRAVASVCPRHPGKATLAIAGRADAETAALINGTAAHVWDLDDASYTGIMHGSALVLPAALAIAQEIDTGAHALRRAFVVGSEVAYVLGDLCTHAHYFRGWWSTLTLGLVGATVAAGRLLDLDENAMATAIGLAAAASGGSKLVFGTEGKPLLVGDAARRAVTIARVARAGLSGPYAAFEGDGGYLQLLNGGEADWTQLDSIGSRWRLTDPGLLFKSSPVCSAAHAAIDQMNDLMTELEAATDDVARIHAEVPELVDMSLIYPDPETPQQMQFSLPYALACAVLHGRVRFEDLAPGAHRDPDKRALMKRVTTTRAKQLSTDEMRARYPEGARLTLTLTDGRSASGFCGIAPGMPERPLSDTALLEKFSAAGAFAGVALPPIEMGNFDPIAVFDHALGATA